MDVRHNGFSRREPAVSIRVSMYTRIAACRFIKLLLSACALSESIAIAY